LISGLDPTFWIVLDNWVVEDSFDLKLVEDFATFDVAWRSILQQDLLHFEQSPSEERRFLASELGG
jgi:hypothetical protein